MSDFESRFTVTLRCNKKISDKRMSAAISHAIYGALDADIPGTEYLNGTIVEYSGVTVEPAAVSSGAPPSPRPISGS